jgi:hypothetical protein
MLSHGLQLCRHVQQLVDVGALSGLDRPLLAPPLPGLAGRTGSHNGAAAAASGGSAAA